MSSEISWRGIGTGNTNYFTVRNASRQMWSTAGTPAFETLTVANWADYKIAMTESASGSYFYVGDIPAVGVGWFYIDLYRQAGAGAAISDTLMGTMYGYWNGTKFEIAGGDIAQVGGVAQDLPKQAGTKGTDATFDSLETKIPTALSFTGANVNAESKITAAPTGMALETSVQAVPTAGENADAVRTNLTTELGRIDAAVSTRAVPGSEMDLVDAPNATAITAIQLGLASSADIVKLVGLTGGKVIKNAAGTEVKKYDSAGNLVVTLNRTGSGPWTWTPTWN